MAERTPLILDVDTGIDDALALLYASASPDAELVAVTCVAGNVDVARVAANTLAVLELAGRTDVPVVLGADRPLVKALVTTPETHGPEGIGYATLPVARRSLEPGDAADRIVELVRSRPGEITLVTLGPLTNLALALEREPLLPGLLRGYVLMGGAYRVSGNTTPLSEWNLHVDPDAAKAVFSAWGNACAADPGVSRPLAMGLDVTEGARLLPAHLAALAMRAGAAGDNRLLAFIEDSTRFYFEFHERYDGFYGAFVHDPFVVAAALDRSLVQTRPVFVDVEAGPGLAHGMTVADWRGLTGITPNLDVATDGDSEAFVGRLVDRVGTLVAGPAAVAG